MKKGASGSPPPVDLICGEVIDACVSGFGRNLSLAFVGGSIAAARASPTSDVDVFVVLDRPDPARERSFASWLRDFHARTGRSFEHAGEILDRATLENLMEFTVRYLDAFPQILQLACYQADCHLSAFRKADVIMKFLDDPKVAVTGDVSFLARLEAVSRDYFHRHPFPRVQEFKNSLEFTVGSVQEPVWARMEQMIDDTRWLDSVLGVGLERWFGPSKLMFRADKAVGDVSQSLAPARRCPLDEDVPAREMLTTQCIGHYNRDCVLALGDMHVPDAREVS